MSGLTSVFSSKRKVWVGGAIALAALVLVARYLDFPPTREAAGTIAPAKRSVAEQPGASDVNGTGQSDTLPTQPGSANASDASRDAVRDASSKAVRDASSNAVRDASSNAVRDASSNAVRDASSNAARDASSNAARDASSNAARDASSNAARDSSSQ